MFFKFPEFDFQFTENRIDERLRQEQFALMALHVFERVDETVEEFVEVEHAVDHEAFGEIPDDAGVFEPDPEGESGERDGHLAETL